MAPAAPPQTNTAAPNSAAAFQFVTELAADVSKGQVELPSYPEVATRVRKALTDPDVSVDRIARIVGSDPGLAARVLTLANSAALNRSGKKTTELKMAISRIGHNNVRTAAVSYAIAQLRQATELKAIAKDLELFWQEATLVAALAYAIAARAPETSADEAMLTGLVHNVGKIYILARGHKYPQLFADREALHAVMRDWHASVGKAILENWNFQPSIIEAVAEYEQIDRVVGFADLTDVLTIATSMAPYIALAEVDFELNMQGVRAFTRLALNNEKCQFIIQECAEEIAALRSALGT